MARGAAQAKRKAAKSKSAKAQTGRRQAAARRPPTVEQTMFFPRLRRQAKWVFLALAFVFAAGFVFFGVGSGSTGIGDLLRGNFNIFGSGGSSGTSSAVKSALKRTQEHPNDPNAWNDLATAYQTDGKLTKANAALEHVIKLRPNDVDALQRVAGFYENRATQKDAEARSLQAQAPLTLGGVVGVSPSSQLSQMLSQDQVSQQLTQKANTAFSDSTSALKKDEQLYKRIAKLQPDDVNTQFHFAQLADLVGDTKPAIAAYKRVIKLAPSDPSAKQARQRIALLTLTARAGKQG
jgi:tetratricopeptide (TPR) repeat protein